ncbi:hypothetical protein PVAP13_6NG201400 [Panicum virgatum]|uniref:Uncharacterized protein n=1 Tax=Panicum virgatum TaxID=38727 RepID=A0A8T0QYJ7_PANVG|nr:hypothetical protein PVAP13_6NG201400 [Panicum virgatum]
MPIPYAPRPTDFHRYSSWGWNDSWAHTPSYLRPYHVEYAAPRETMRAGQPYVDNDHLNVIDEKPINVLETSAIDGKGREKLTFDIPNAKSEQSELKKPKIKKKSLLSRIEAKPSHPLDSSNWQKEKLQRLSAQELKQRDMARREGPRDDLQNYWSVHHPFDLPMSYMPMSWNSSYNMFGYPSCSNFDPRMTYGSLYHGGLSPNCYAY